jgi:hypothetical protein
MDSLPISSVNYLPEWFPGGGFKKTAAGMRALRERFMHEPFNFTKAEIVRRLLSGIAHD